jgi:D-glycero-alpha-D-manno-heptose 1-phosphate guanylyltransferase
MIGTAVILAGGFGTRLQSVVRDVPKPMAPVNGTPFLTFQLRFLKHYGIQKVIMAVGYLADVIIAHYGSSFEGIAIHYVHEHSPLGTGGGIRFALDKCEEDDVLVLNGDSFFDIDLNKFVTLHDENLVAASLALRKVDDASRFGTIELASGCRISGFREKDGAAKPGLINGGIYVLNKNIFMQNTPAEGKFSIEKDFFEKQASRMPLCGFEFDGFFIDIGVPEDYKKAQHDFERFKY